MIGEGGPTWLEPVTLEDWPTHVVQSGDLHYRIPLREGWSVDPETSQTPSEQTHVYRGQLLSEVLSVSFLPKADPQSYLGNWVEAMIFIDGFPIPAMQSAESKPELLEWNQVWGGDDLAVRLGADEIFLYQGMANIPGEPPDLSHFYIVLVRRGTQAWKVCLSFSSACPPGTPEEIVQDNDHIRAGAIFGYLELI
jgi:hypothetical protein